VGTFGIRAIVGNDFNTVAPDGAVLQAVGDEVIGITIAT
jgi:hypothetical protein